MLNFVPNTKIPTTKHNYSEHLSNTIRTSVVNHTLVQPIIRTTTIATTLLIKIIEPIERWQFEWESKRADSEKERSDIYLDERQCASTAKKLWTVNGERCVRAASKQEYLLSGVETAQCE